MFFDGSVAFHHMLLCIRSDKISLFFVFNLIFPWIMISSLCIDYWFHLSFFHNCSLCGSILYTLICLWDHFVDVLFLRTYFVCFVSKSDCWFLFGLFVYFFRLRSLHVSLSLHCRIQYLYWVPFSLWYYHIVNCWLYITDFIRSCNFNFFLVLLNWSILYLVDCIVIIYLYVFLQIL